MAKKTSGQNPVDEAYLRSLMAGVPSEPSLSPASLIGESGENRETALSDEKGKADDRVNETVKDVSATDNDSYPELIAEKPSPKTIRTTLADFIRKFLTPYKCEGRQGGIYRQGTAPENIGYCRDCGKTAANGRQLYRQCVEGTFRETFGRGEDLPPKKL